MASISRNSIPGAAQRPFSSITGRDDVSQVWAVNTSGDHDGQPSELLITIRGADGSVNALNIPQAAVAFELTSMAPRDAMVRSGQFISAVNNGLLTLVTEEYALRLNDGAVAQSEFARMQQRRVAIANSGKDAQSILAGSDRNVATQVTVTHRDPLPSHASVEARVPQARVSLSDLAEEFSVDADFREWLNATNETTQADAVQRFVARGTITAEEAQYAAEHTVHTKIKAFLTRAAS